MKNIRFAVVVFVLVILSMGCGAKDALKSNKNTLDKPGKKAFSIYGFIPYGGYSQNGHTVNTTYQRLQQYLLSFGINRLNLYYENKLLNYPNGDKANGIPDVIRIDSLGNAAKNDLNTPVSLDLEGWNRFDTIRTPGRLIAIINEFKKVNGSSQVGLYATVPQNTYGYSAAINKYDNWNKAYFSVAASVDYFSPSLYNYNGTDTSAWNKAAVYNINACKQYKFTTKRILPYITPEVRQNGVTTLLSYDEMMSHLLTLYNLGADGCIVWTSSQTRDSNSNKIYVDVNSGWGKAIVDFIANH